MFLWSEKKEVKDEKDEKDDENVLFSISDKDSVELDHNVKMSSVSNSIITPKYEMNVYLKVYVFMLCCRFVKNSGIKSHGDDDSGNSWDEFNECYAEMLTV
jgi:hypothetical protein